MSVHVALNVLTENVLFCYLSMCVQNVFDIVFSKDFP